MFWVVACLKKIPKHPDRNHKSDAKLPVHHIRTCLTPPFVLIALDQSLANECIAEAISELVAQELKKVQPTFLTMLTYKLDSNEY